MISDVVDDQIERQGVAVFTVSDGHVLVLTRAILQKLLAAAQSHDDGRVMLQVKSGPAA